MKTLCFFSGSLRLDLNTIIHYIKEFKKHFENMNHEITYLFITDKKNPYIYLNLDHFKTEISKHATVLFVEPNHNLNVNTMNNYSTISLMYYNHIQDYINKTNSNFDYIMKIRNDTFIKINKIEKYFNNNTYVLPRYWYNTNPNSLANDHFFIMPFLKFINIDFSNLNINKLAPLNWDTEILTQSIILPDKTIDIHDVLEYLLNGSTKFHIKHNKIITCSYDPFNSLAKII
jgi:hypothetical protein